MSIDIMNRIWWREDIPMVEKFVAMALADAANDEGVAYPAIATIALKCSCSERSVQKAVKALCGKGLLRRRERQDRSSFYIFVLDNLPLIERERRFFCFEPCTASSSRTPRRRWPPDPDASSMPVWTPERFAFGHACAGWPDWKQFMQTCKKPHLPRHRSYTELKAKQIFSPLGVVVGRF